MSIFDYYKYIMEKEARLRTGRTTRYCDLPIEPPPQMADTTKRILEIAKNNTILRSGNRTGHLTTATMAYESDGGHTNLVRSLVKYGFENYSIRSNYISTYKDYFIDEAVTWHDLPENETGDIPDNRNRNEAEKLQQENAYFEQELKSPNKDTTMQLLREMQDKSSPEGRILYVADKLSAIIMMLVYDKLAYDHLCHYPHVYTDEKSISKIDQKEIDMCQKRPNGSILLSELWTVDFLYGRKIVNYDDGGFYTAILVMATLLVHNEWYEWREKQYL